MMRQCAWCLCLIDSAGARISSQPIPKQYNATHGMCEVCGASWLEQVQKTSSQDITGMLLQMQKKKKYPAVPSSVIKRKVSEKELS